MAGIFGALDINDTDRGFLANVGQGVAWDLVDEWVAQYNASFANSVEVFVEAITDKFKERYKLPGGGRLQKLGKKAKSGATKTSGKYDVAYPLEGYGAAFIANDVDLAYATARELANHIETVVLQDVNTVRWEILHRLYDNVQEPFSDDINGSLSIEPLANGDTVVYPPVIGSETEATEDHYVGSNYLASAISDTNNPLVTIRKDLEHHPSNRSYRTGGANVVVFCNSAQTEQLAGLTDFTEVIDNYIMAGDNVDVPMNYPNVPGLIKGRSNGVWVVEWDWTPANYLLGICLDTKGPLKMRVDPSDTGLPMGLSIMPGIEDHPFEGSRWRHRFGIGAGHRLNGFVMHLAATTSYTVPTAYD